MRIPCVLSYPDTISFRLGRQRVTRNDDILFSLKRVTLECWILLTRLQLAQRERKTRRGDAREDGDSGAAKGETLLEDERAVERGDEPVALQQGSQQGRKESQLAYSKQRSGRLYFYIKYRCQSLSYYPCFSSRTTAASNGNSTASIVSATAPQHPFLSVRPVHSGIYIKRLRDDDN